MNLVNCLMTRCLLILRQNFFLVFAATLFLPFEAACEETNWLDLKPPPTSTRKLNRMFEDLVVVQERARVKKGHFLFNTFGSIDFSDGPVTFYNLALNFGYAVTNEFETYLSVSPVFFPIERSINEEVKKIIDIDGKEASLQFSVPEFQGMVEFLWAPAYGKDSWGPYSIIRSDTFLKLGFGGVLFEDGESGTRINALVGKTFFVHNLFNLRIAAGTSFLESVVQNQKAFSAVGLFEIGLVWYI